MFCNGHLLFIAQIFYSPHRPLMSHWLTLHSGPVKQTNHSPALMFLSNYFPESLSPALHTLPFCFQCLTHTHNLSLPAWANETANAGQQFTLESISADLMSLIWLHIKLWFNVWLGSCGYYSHQWRVYEHGSGYSHDLFVFLMGYWH